MSFPKYEPSRLASLPTTLDPAEYDISPETRKAQAERLAIRSRLKREYLLQYNDPSRRGLVDKKEKLIQEGKLDRTFNISY
uniref:NADH dehydrogenase [ubiquinone] 1 beta subcomplex subunit 4 n=1 Tax=Equus asinus asinus TaxID=83772 RepID=A0A8C4M3C7_EQUAS